MATAKKKSTVSKKSKTPLLRSVSYNDPRTLALAALFTIGVVAFGYLVVYKSLAAVGPSGVAIPTGDLANPSGGSWHEIFADDFSINSTTTDGQNWQNTNTGGKIVYTGANAAPGGTTTKWTTYPENYLDTYQKRPYQSGKVLSVHDGVLDFYLHNVNGIPAGANPSPQITGSSNYQLYGRYSARIKTDRADMTGYYAAWLLWPQLDSNYQCAESDYPEGQLKTNGSVNGFHHYGCAGSQDALSGSANLTDWHTYTQEWGPGYRKYYIDNTLIKTSTNSVWNQPQRWQLQTETNGTDITAFKEGHLLVDWVAVYAYSPNALATATPSPTPTPVVKTPVPTSTPTATPVPALAAATVPVVNGLIGQYFNSQTLTGALITRTDSNVNFNWGLGSPMASIGSDHFSVRWLGYVTAPVSGTYTFGTNADDGARLWVAGQQLVNNWVDQGATLKTGTISLTAGTKYPVMMEYYDNGFQASAQLEWSYPGQSLVVIPTKALTTN